jgi:hypothetical protein
MLTRVAFVVWTTALGRILTLDNLKKGTGAGELALKLSDTEVMALEYIDKFSLMPLLFLKYFRFVA